MTEPWPCHCSKPGHRNVYGRGYCIEHLAALYRRFEPSVFGVWGIGLPRDDGTLECPCCGATWHEPEPFLTCPWCSRRTINERRWQAERVLTPPDIDGDDELFDRVMIAWAKRLRFAVDAELITMPQAERALDRGLRRATT